MKVGLYNLEPNIVNSALMRVACWHKQHGDEVEYYFALAHDLYDKIYCFSIFNFTDKQTVTSDMIHGGTGFDLINTLPSGIEKSDYDYSFYPDCDFSLVWFSTGCINHCPFCVVSKKEGYIRNLKPKPLNLKGKYIRVMDNSFFDNPEYKESVNYLKKWNQPVLFENLNIRTFNKFHAEIIKLLKIKGYLHFAWDNPKEDLYPKFKQLCEWINPNIIACYVLIGYWSTPEQDLDRVEKLRSLKIHPFVMPYNKFDNYQRRFARWVNHKAIFNSVKWEDYKS